MLCTLPSLILLPCPFSPLSEPRLTLDPNEPKFLSMRTGREWLTFLPRPLRPFDGLAPRLSRSLLADALDETDLGVVEGLGREGLPGSGGGVEGRSGVWCWCWCCLADLVLMVDVVRLRMCMVVAGVRVSVLA